jgi:N-acetylmuramoyl-L-alanine amidase
MSTDRTRRRLMCVAVMVLALSPVAPSVLAATAASNDTIAAFSVSGSPFAPDLAPLPEQVDASLVLSRSAKVTVRVFTLGGTRVRTLALRAARPAGTHHWTWDGRNGAGAFVADGVYELRVRVENSLGAVSQKRRVRKGLPPIFPANPGSIVIAVDPGHGGRFSGAVRDGYAEKDFNLDIGLNLRDLLLAAGVQVVMSRTTDVAVDQPASDRNGDGKLDRYDDDLARNDSANLARADVVVHVHNNASTSTKARGTGTYTSLERSWTPEAVELAQLMVAEEFIALDAYRTPSFKPRSNGVQGGWYYYVGPYDPPYLPRPTLMPSVLSESLFLSNPSELEALKRADVRVSLAAAIYLSLAEYLNSRDLGIGYELLSGPASPVPAGSAVSYQLRVTNHGNATSSGWTLQVHSVPAVPLYDGSGQLGSLMGSVAVPDGLQPGASVDLTVNALAPASAGNWLVKSDVRLADSSYASTAGVVSIQVPLTTAP